MADVIQLLPDAIANQIAAGEVIQRPASLVKELLENAIDAGSTQIKLIVKDAGKALVQIIDNGCGMSETDARMSFERHATSKIKKSADLFAIHTMGFRGEALASIAAVAQVELKTRRQADELGTRIAIEASTVQVQEACQCTAGTSISIKNLFFNVPARRKFLKSNTVEMRHIIDEFQRIAIAHPDIFFSLHHNNTEIFHLPIGNLRQRLVNIWGNTTNKKLVPITEETDILKLYGFIGKPKFAKKTRGEQLFFVNKRFIKSGYLHHAVVAAYEDLLPKDSHPLYAIFIEMDTTKIDINVHPTKQEIKFDDERLVYNYLKVTIRHALGQHSIIPSLDFNQEMSFSQLPSFSNSQEKTQDQESNSSKKDSSASGSPKQDSQLDASNLKNWRKLYDGIELFDEEENNDHDAPDGSITIESNWSTSPELDDAQKSFSTPQTKPYQLHSRYIVSPLKSGFVLIDQQAAHERILYEKYLVLLNKSDAITQKQLFSKNITVPAADVAILKDMLPNINQLGFDIQEFGQDGFVVHGIPADWQGQMDEQTIIEQLIEQYKANLDLNIGMLENIAQSMSRQASIKKGQSLTEQEMRQLIDKLFACEIPFKSPTGGNCFITFELDDLERQFHG